MFDLMIKSAKICIDLAERKKFGKKGSKKRKEMDIGAITLKRTLGNFRFYDSITSTYHRYFIDFSLIFY